MRRDTAQTPSPPNLYINASNALEIRRTTIKSTSAGSNSSAEVIVESSTASFPKFGDINFSNVAINGNPIGTDNPILLDASNNYGYEDHTSAVSGSNFSVTYLRE